MGDRDIRERESPRVSGQPIPQDAVDRMGGGRSEGANPESRIPQPSLYPLFPILYPLPPANHAHDTPFSLP